MEQEHIRDEMFSKRVYAGRRTYYLDVKTTKSGNEPYVVISEKRKFEDGKVEKHRIFLYKEDFEKFIDALDEVIDFAREQILTTGKDE